MQAAGKRNQRITIERKTVTRNSIGEEIETWSTLATVWAEAHPTRGREFFAAGGEHARADVMFRILYRTDITITEEDRVVWAGKNHDLVAPPVDVSGAHEVIELYCVHGVRDGR